VEINKTPRNWEIKYKVNLTLFSHGVGGGAHFARAEFNELLLLNG